MRRTALILLTLSLVALGCDAGALCAASQAGDAKCCCPMSMDGTMSGMAPCMEESDETPTPADQDATFDGPTQHWDLARMQCLSVEPPCRVSESPRLDRDPAAGHGPAVYLLACSFRN